MARNDIPNGWDKIRQNVQETERLMGQKQYNQSMIKAKQTVEYMVKLQCEQAGIMEGSMDSMIHELYNNGWISKSFLQRKPDQKFVINDQYLFHVHPCFQKSGAPLFRSPERFPFPFCRGSARSAGLRSPDRARRR